MSVILHIETATDLCSVAVSQDSAIIFQTDNLPKEGEEPKQAKGTNHASILGTMVDEALSFTDNHAIPFDAVAVSAGPGSYTGLRIGTSMAKGVAYGRNLKLIAVSTLEIQCVPILLVHDDLPEDALLCPMLDARRMEVYAALYDRALKPVRQVQADVVDAQTYAPWLEQRPVYFFGNGAAKCMDVIRNSGSAQADPRIVANAHLLEGIEPQARWMQPLAERRLLDGQTEDVAYYEPFYLKDFVAKQPKDLLHQP